MADGKNIEIKIAATGGDQAAAEIRKPVEASKGFGGMLDGVPERAEEAAEAVKQVGAAAVPMSEHMGEAADEVERLAESAEDATDKSGELDENVSNIARAQKAQALAGLAGQVAQIGQKFQQAADEVEGFDAEMAATLRRTGQGLDQVAQSVTTVAMGFAMGGPLGGAVAALAATLNVLFQSWASSEQAAAKSAAAQVKALEEVNAATRVATTAALQRNTELASERTLAALDSQFAKVEKITGEMNRQVGLMRDKRRLENEVLTANDQADLAGVDLEEARGNLNPLQAAEKRSRIEAEARRRQREERKRLALEDAAAAGVEALLKTQAAEAARKAADELAAKSAAANAKATELTDYAKSEGGKIVTGAGGGISDSDREFINQIQAELTDAKNVLVQLSRATAEAEAKAQTAAKDAATARQTAGDRNTNAQATIATVDQLDAADRRRTGTAGQTLAVTRFNQAKERADAEAEKKKREDAAKAEARQRAQDNLETAASGLGVDAGKAAGKLGFPGVRAGLQRLGLAIAKDGDPTGDDAKVGEMLSMIKDLIGIAEANGKGNNANTQELREVKKQIETLRRQASNKQ